MDEAIEIIALEETDPNADKAPEREKDFGEEKEGE